MAPLGPVIIDIPLLSDVIIGLRTIRKIKLFKYLPELVEDEDEPDEETPDHIDCEDENDSDNEETEVEWDFPKEPSPAPIHIQKLRPLYKITNLEFHTLEPEEED